MERRRGEEICEGYGDERDLDDQRRRQREMCIRESISRKQQLH